jgi:hypothetical protein
MTLITHRPRRFGHAALLLTALAGCGSPAAKHEQGRKAAYAAYNEALKTYGAKNYSAAEPQLTAAIEARGLNPDIYCSAVTKRAACWAVAGKLTEALAELETLGPAASNMDEILALKSFIYKKQGKAADSRAALAKAKRINPRIQEFKG